MEVTPAAAAPPQLPHVEATDMYRIATYGLALLGKEVVCVRVNLLIAVAFLLLSLYSLSQILGLWLAGSKLSSRKIVFLLIFAACALRSIWYSLSALDMLPFVGDLSPPLITAISLEQKLVLSQYAYLFPMAQLFTAASWIIINWFQLYQKEKLRKKMKPALASSLNSTPRERRLKAEGKQRRLQRFAHMLNVGLHLAVVLLVFSSTSSWSDAYSVLEYIGMVPPEALLAFLCLLSTAALSFYGFRYLANLKLARDSDSHKLKHHTVFSLALIFSVLCYFAFILLCFLIGVFDVSTNDIDGSLVRSGALSHTHMLLRTFEALQALLIISVLASDRLSLRAPFPANRSAITSDWLTSVLQENGTIKSTTTVIGYSMETLYGGCHFKVVRVSLRYSVEKPDDPHKTIVVKLLYWDKNFWDRVVVYVKYLLNSLDKEAMYLTSYRVESEFYKGKIDVAGIKLPEIYYNLEDVFNNRFGMILEDLSKKDDGQPLGFTREQAEIILAGLAEFHAVHFRRAPSAIVGWKVAGYWTGKKRASKKRKIARAWEKVQNNFSEEELRSRYDSFGSMLHAKLKWLGKEFKGLIGSDFETLCHGDFKISNLFVSRKKPGRERKVYVIDYQWFGRGNPLIDTTYFLYTSLHEEALGYIDGLLNFYYERLTSFPGVVYPRDEFMHHHRVVLTDFCLYCIVSKWCDMTAVEFRENQHKQKDGLHLRSTAHMINILSDVYSFVNAWDEDASKDSEPSSSSEDEEAEAMGGDHDDPDDHALPGEAQ
eukprot:TRINITY_DN7507_c0_g1_i1.p1 TRINITY_DN7507_c0_g1~~TRINITY_DN7507_c0_g1_i1.p1  ORF type:complete len:769 (-),score=301.66 TRINITY_DN7507_c0_g1_i1:298-2604(-)